MKKTIFILVAFASISINSLGQRPNKTESVPMSVNEALPTNISEDNQGETYEVVNAASVNVRSAASTSSRIVGKLKKGETIAVLGISNGWARCMLNGKEVFVSSRYLKKIEVEPPIDESVDDFEGTNEALPISSETSITTQDYNTETTSESNVGKIKGCMELNFGYVMPNLGDASKYVDVGFCCGMAFGFGARYYATENVYLEGLLGYKWIATDTEIKSSSITTSNTMHFLTIPLHLGYRGTSTGKVALGVFFGTRLDVPLKCKSEVKVKYETETVDLDVPFSALLECGIDIIIKNSGSIRLQYGYSPKKENKYSILSLGYSMGF